MQLDTEDRVPLARRLLDVVENDILPLTEAGVAKGNKIFGAAILRKADWSLVIAETNNETENPLWHGEMHALKRFYEQAGHPETKDLVFLATHEPCPLCLSAITWAGFDNFFHLFGHADSRDRFAIPHDLKILKEVFGLEPDGYRRENAFWSAASIGELSCDAEPGERAAIEARIQSIAARYADLSATYQAGKAENRIPLN
ncbi:nucleoside deaminase [Pararhizobium mangrovi]|uniref:Nucleoside deaminase n=1 Tax=Pararhizobium mangrovi TaxID=2590452 RepID=A0A506UDY5_9HYPH|nr:nucleoside deaminase [Pararhizobium mangrovi]TPW31341.1 nucleoside deaminase [Pararhizobium mangrovi]